MFSIKALILYVLFFVIGWLLARWLWNKKQTETLQSSSSSAADVRPSAAVSTNDGTKSVSQSSKPEEFQNSSVSASQPDKKIAEKSEVPKPVTPAHASAPKNDTKKTKSETNETTATPAAKVSKKEPKKATESKTPERLKAPRDGEADDLKKIKGVGKKIEEKLNGFGIYHFDQIANWTDEQVKWIGSELAFAGRIERENWIEQANVLASGGDTEFSRRVEKGKVSSSKG